MAVQPYSATAPIKALSGSQTAPGITFTGGDTDTGIYSPGANQVGITTGGTNKLIIDENGSLQVVRGTKDLPAIYFDGGTGIYSPGDNQVALATNGTPRVNFGTGEVVFNDGGENYDFRIEGDTEANLLFVDASTNRVGVGTSSPGATFHIEGLGNTVNQRIFTSDNVLNATASLTFGTTPGARSKAAIQMVNTNTGNAAGSLAFQTNSGSALNTALYIADTGRVGIGTQTPESELHISKDNITAKIILQRTSSATAKWSLSAGGGSLLFRDESSSNERARFDSDGRLLVGTPSARGNFFNTTNIFPAVQIENTGSSGGLSIVRQSNDNGGAFIPLCKSRGTSVGDNTLVSDDDDLGALLFLGSDGTEFVAGAGIIGQVDGTPGANDMPGRLVFSTTADGASSPTERMRISSNGSIRTGNTLTYTGTTGAVTATTGTVVFSFDFSGTTTRHTAMIRLSVMHLAATNDINEQAAAEYVFAAEAYTTGAVAATSPAAVFQNQYVAATHFAFASTGGTAFTITLTEPTGTAASAVYYKVEILDKGSACSLISVATT